MNSSMPAARASSTAYWISGLSTKGSISFGSAFVAGRNRVPRPPTGKIALRTWRAISLDLQKNNGDFDPLIVRTRSHDKWRSGRVPTTMFNDLVGHLHSINIQNGRI